MAKSQKERVLQYIRDYGSITTFEAFQQLGVTRLASRISDLCDDGYDFVRKQESSLNRYGDPVFYTRYSLREE